MLRLKQEVEPSLQRSLICRLQKCHDSPSFISPSKYIWQICKHYKNMQNCKTGLQIDVRSPLSSPFFLSSGSCPEKGKKKYLFLGSIKCKRFIIYVQNHSGLLQRKYSNFIKSRHLHNFTRVKL